jgi:hypothetical protein
VPYASRSDCIMAGVMTDRVRIIPHALRSISDSGSFEVWFVDGRPSQYFYWDDNRGRASITRKMNQDEAREHYAAPTAGLWLITMTPRPRCQVFAPG